MTVNRLMMQGHRADWCRVCWPSFGADDDGLPDLPDDELEALLQDKLAALKAQNDAMASENETIRIQNETMHEQLTQTSKRYAQLQNNLTEQLADLMLRRSALGNDDDDDDEEDDDDDDEKKASSRDDGGEGGRAPGAHRKKGSWADDIAAFEEKLERTISDADRRMNHELRKIRRAAHGRRWVKKAMHNTAKYGGTLSTSEALLLTLRDEADVDIAGMDDDGPRAGHSSQTQADILKALAVLTGTEGKSADDVLAAVGIHVQQLQKEEKSG